MTLIAYSRSGKILNGSTYKDLVLSLRQNSYEKHLFMVMIIWRLEYPLSISKANQPFNDKVSL